MPSTSAITGGASLPLVLPNEVGGAGLADRSRLPPASSSTARAAGPSAAARTAGGSTPVVAKAAAAKTAGTTKSSASKAAKKTGTAAKPGYATIKLPAEFAFLKDPKLSIEEKLSRFIGVMMTRSEQDLLAQMEKMAPGSTASAATTSTSTAKPSTATTAKKGTSIWGLAKALVPPLGLATAVLGDASVKSLITQVSGPVLAAAATAVGLPELAPLALKLGPTVAGLVTSDTPLDLAGLTSSAGQSSGGKASATSGGEKSSSSSAPTTGATTTAKVAATDGPTSEKAQLMELQRLQDRDNEMYTLFSNMLKAMHDARMTAIQNIR